MSDVEREAADMVADAEDGFWDLTTLVSAALEVSWYETADNPEAHPLNALDGFAGTTGDAAADALRRLAREIQEYRETLGKWHERRRRKEGKQA